jgi:two-component sensor histidine kinase
LNHRVKNNLALVSSLISLKEEELGAPADLQDIRNHISAMEFLHEQLYQTNRVTSIDFRTYAQALLPRLFSFYSGGHVKIEGAMESLLMPTKTAVSIGVILNELATNAMKHGFLESEDAVFRVSLTTEDSAAAEDAGPDATAPPEPDTIDPPRLSADTVRPATEEPRYCVLKVGNSGRSFPAEVSLENPGTLGLRLISALVSQLKGSLDITRRPSATFTLRFPL